MWKRRKAKEGNVPFPSRLLPSLRSLTRLTSATSSLDPEAKLQLEEQFLQIWVTYFSSLVNRIVMELYLRRRCPLLTIAIINRLSSVQAAGTRLRERHGDFVQRTQLVPSIMSSNHSCFEDGSAGSLIMMEPVLLCPHFATHPFN